MCVIRIVATRLSYACGRGSITKLCICHTHAWFIFFFSTTTSLLWRKSTKGFALLCHAPWRHKIRRNGTSLSPVCCCSVFEETRPRTGRGPGPFTDAVPCIRQPLLLLALSLRVGPSSPNGFEVREREWGETSGMKSRDVKGTVLGATTLTHQRDQRTSLLCVPPDSLELLGSDWFPLGQQNSRQQARSSSFPPSSPYVNTGTVTRVGGMGDDKAELTQPGSTPATSKWQPVLSPVRCCPRQRP